jgi:hypothetical protein
MVGFELKEKHIIYDTVFPEAGHGLTSVIYQVKYYE